MADEIDYDNLPPLIPAGTSDEEREEMLDEIAKGWVEDESEWSEFKWKEGSPAELRSVSLADADRGPIDLSDIIRRRDSDSGTIALRGCDIPACDLTGHEIAASFHVPECRFGDRATFDKATFRQGGRFDWTTFSGRASFHRTTFVRRVSFDRAAFRGPVSFRDLRTAGRATWDWSTFLGTAHFCGARINGDATFDGARFKELVSFANASIKGIADFGDTDFGGRAAFGLATIGGPAWFNRSRFGERASFDGTEFKSPADFELVVSIARLGFVGAKFRKDVSFANATLGSESSFHQAQFGGSLNASNATFAERTSFAGATMQGRCESSLQGATFGGYADFEGFDLSSFNLRDASLAGAKLRDLRRISTAPTRTAAVRRYRTMRVATRKAQSAHREVDWPIRHFYALYRTAFKTLDAIDRKWIHKPSAFTPDGTSLRDARLDIDPADDWTRLRRKFTGLNLTLNLAALAIFGGRYAAEAFGYKAAAWLSEVSENASGSIDPSGTAAALAEPAERWYLIWMLTKIDEAAENWWLPGFVIFLAVYNAGVLYVTHKVAALRDEEDRSGFTPTIPEYVPLVTWSRWLWAGKWLALASVLYQATLLLFTPVPKFDMDDVRARSAEVQQQALTEAQRLQEVLATKAAERAVEAAKAEIRAEVDEQLERMSEALERLKERLPLPVTPTDSATPAVADTPSTTGDAPQ